MGKDHKDLVVLLTQKRKEAGITQASLAEAVQVSRKSINAIENGINWPLSGGAGQFEYYMKSKVIGRDAVTHNSFLYVWTNIGVLALLFVVPFYLAIKKLKMSAKTKYLVIILLGYNLFYDMIASAMLMMAHGFVFGMINCERKEELIL